MCIRDRFNLINPPNNVTISWTATPSNAFSQSSGTGSIATLSVLSSASGNGSITFSVPHPSKGSISFTSNFSFSNLTGLINISIHDEYNNNIPEMGNTYLLCPNTIYHFLASPIPVSYTHLTLPTLYSV